MKTYRFNQLVSFINTADRKDLEELRLEFNQAVEFGDISKAMHKRLSIALQKRRDVISKH
jgi:hypothetical protein